MKSNTGFRLVPKSVNGVTADPRYLLGMWAFVFYNSMKQIWKSIKKPTLFLLLHDIDRRWTVGRHLPRAVIPLLHQVRRWPVWYCVQSWRHVTSLTASSSSWQIEISTKSYTSHRIAGPWRHSCCSIISGWRHGGRRPPKRQTTPTFSLIVT